LKYNEVKKRRFKDKALKITKQSQNGLAKKALFFFPLGFGFNPLLFLLLQLLLQLVKFLFNESAFWQIAIAIFTALSCF
jgi:hypothetical protein